ncbi:MFS transporter [Phenylobacterium sp.]|jgi:predicted MFS family arabinose efflux permease|uniref:MFS transporter n=1 Tax=Phenylobacterium sp. TaxID=1871053 RepID=UPI0025E8FA67|nr:MFS transporter [Phenylobacterium sp.]MCA6285755.1 MFS transporter [Phenylobacterium sp.]MCA6288500.1 MFS transporter [Phenylobacterium sp.]MCA6310049.1 MFS transporter [Phenylobacterium sp.]MCA6324358.1 MFS transporter [Phenylobacterium sp.]MCA6336859.1 MFS transporter [Phenylobacterium sp.]
MNPRILVLTLSTFAFGSTAFIFAGVLETMAQDLGVATAVAGQLQTSYVLVSALLGPPLAWLLGKADRKVVLAAALGFGALANLACAMAPGFQSLLALRTLVGLAAAIAGPTASVAAAALVPPERRGSAVAMVMGGMTMAFVIGIPLGSFVGAHFGWRSTFVLAGALTAIAFAGVITLMPSVRPPPPSAGGRIALAPLLPLYAGGFLCFAANMTVNLFIAPVVRVGAGVTGAGVGVFQMVIGLGSIVGLSLGGRAGDRGEGREWLITCFLGQLLAMSLHVAATSHLTPPGLPSQLMVAMAIFIASTSLFSLMPVLSSRIIQTSQGAPLAMAVNGSVNSMGQALGSAVGGFALATVGVPGIPLSAIGISVAGLVMTTLLIPRRTSPAPAGPP